MTRNNFSDSDNLNCQKWSSGRPHTKSVEVKHQERKTKQTNCGNTVKMSRYKTA